MMARFDLEEPGEAGEDKLHILVDKVDREAHDRVFPSPSLREPVVGWI